MFSSHTYLGTVVYLWLHCPFPHCFRKIFSFYSLQIAYLISEETYRFRERLTAPVLLPDITWFYVFDLRKYSFLTRSRYFLVVL